MLPGFLKIGILVNWQINQEFIAQNTCKFRFEDNNSCQGNCQLKLSLEKFDPISSNEYPISRSAQNFDETFIGILTKSEGLIDLSFSLVLNSYFYHSQYTYLKTDSLFHPPQQMV